jgi:hypothetical protein
VESQTRSTLTLAGVPLAHTGNRVVIAEVAADRITGVWEDRGPGIPTTRLLGPNGSGAFFEYGGNTVVKALLSFNAQTGKVTSLLPLANRSRQEGGPDYTVESGPGKILLRGDFPGVYDATARNVAPAGACQVALSADGGQVIEVVQ